MKHPTHDRLPLQVLADELHVHVRTLRVAAHDGRLAATFAPRSYFGKLTATPRERPPHDSWRRGIGGRMDVVDAAVS